MLSLQQRLPFTVLKQPESFQNVAFVTIPLVATALTVYGIETLAHFEQLVSTLLHSCNSAYRLRY